MKVGKEKTKIISKPFLYKDDGLFDINICPCCGNELGKVEPHRYTKEGLFYTITYRECEELKCPDCGASFSKKIADKRELNNIRDILMISMIILSFIFLALGLFLVFTHISDTIGDIFLVLFMTFITVPVIIVYFS